MVPNSKDAKIHQDVLHIVLNHVVDEHFVYGRKRTY